MSAIRKSDSTEAMMLFILLIPPEPGLGLLSKVVELKRPLLSLAHVYLVSGYQCRLGRRDVVRLRSSALISFEMKSVLVYRSVNV